MRDYRILAARLVKSGSYYGGLIALALGVSVITGLPVVGLLLIAVGVGAVVDVVFL